MSPGQTDSREHRSVLKEGDNLLSLRSQVRLCEAELLVDALIRSRGAEGLHAVGHVRVPVPALTGAGLDGHHGHSVGEHAHLVLERLLVEQLAARHRHHAHRDALRRQRLRHTHCDDDLSAGGRQDEARA